MPEPVRALPRVADRPRPAGRRPPLRTPPESGDQFPVDMQAARSANGRRSALTNCGAGLTSSPISPQPHPGLLPANVGLAAVHVRLRDDAPRFLRTRTAVWDYLAGDPDYIALCHWNANVDNAWFWRDTGSALHCGLMDWGCAGQMNVAMAIWGAMSGAETEMWDHHLDELLQPVRRGGKPLRRARSQRQRTAPSGHALRRGHDNRLAARHPCADPKAFRRRRRDDDQKRPRH